MRLSIIVPTLNEASYLRLAIACALGNSCLGTPEIIVSDCGSSDGTAGAALRMNARLVTGDPPFESRARAVNAAASGAAGDVFLFLDADTLLPRGYDESIRDALEDPRVTGGAFELRLDGSAPGLRLIEMINRVRYRLEHRYFSDQAIFVRKSAFEAIGGYPDRRIMDAYVFCKILARTGRLALVRSPVTTSSRRFSEEGTLRVFATDTKIWFLERLGIASDRHAEAYRANNRRRGTGTKFNPPVQTGH